LNSQFTNEAAEMRLSRLILVMLVLPLIIAVNIVKWLAGDEDYLT